MARRGINKEKVLLLLLGGLALSLQRSPKGYFRMVKNIHKEWRKINQRALTKAINSLYRSNLLEQKNNRDGTVTFVLSRNGKREALTYNLDKMSIPKLTWDKVWRLVLFDIPEKKKKIREVFRYHLKRLGFVELQRSVFILPFKCRDEIDYLIEFYNIRRFVRFVEARFVDNELDLRRKFNLPLNLN